MSATELIALSIHEDRTITEYPATLDEAHTLVNDLGVLAADECPIDHLSGVGYSGSESVGYYDIWGTDGASGGQWRVHVVTAEVPS